MELNKKIELFYDICGDWDYRRNIDMTEPHLSGVDIDGDVVKFSCEMFSPEVDEYISCDAGSVKDKNLVKKFKMTNFSKKDEVLELIEEIEALINWRKITDKLYDELDDNFLVPRKVPSEFMGEGWYWKQHNDGSGCLVSPEGKEYMEYDLLTNEYKETRESDYDFFPLDYYYADGVDPKDFKPFEFMEKEMARTVLPKEEKEMSL